MTDALFLSQPSGLTHRNWSVRGGNHASLGQARQGMDGSRLRAVLGPVETKLTDQQGKKSNMSERRAEGGAPNSVSAII